MSAQWEPRPEDVMATASLMCREVERNRPPCYVCRGMCKRLLTNLHEKMGVTLGDVTQCDEPEGGVIVFEPGTVYLDQSTGTFHRYGAENDDYDQLDVDDSGDQDRGLPR